LYDLVLSYVCGRLRVVVTVEIIKPGRGGFASFETLRRRGYLRVLRLPFGRALVIGRLSL
jgi:hypothetical protein